MPDAPNSRTAQFSPAETTAACTACGRRYDVHGLAPDATLRCVCGAVIGAVAVPSIAVRTLTCAHCGGSFDADAERCPWCAAGIALEDRKLAGVCPQCSKRAAIDAVFCASCGARLAAQPLAPVDALRGCPRCKSALRARRVAERELIECSSCGGLWLPPATLEELCRDAERGSIAAELAPPQLPPATVERSPGYLGCAACGEPMMRRNFGGSSGVIVDVCKDHGVWLDALELERILAWSRSGGMERERTRRVERERLMLEHERDAQPAQDLAGWRTDATCESGMVETLSALAHWIARRRT